MRVGVTASQPPPYTVCPPPRCSVNSRNHPSNIKLLSTRLQKLPRINFRCNCAGDSGENESKRILDAFFLGKAVAEVLNERIESAVGEFMSILGRLQAEQQKQVQEFQEEVFENARRAKEQAARDAQGLIPNSTAVEKISVAVNGDTINASTVSDSITSGDSYDD